jgi:pimeloyl-ACP methyl ester carboxylesterase
MHFTAESILGLLALLGLGAAIALALATWHTARVLTRPYRRTYASALAKGRPGDPGELQDAAGSRRAFTSWDHQWQGLRLPVWDIPGDDPAGPVIVFSHGWGDSRIGGLSRAQALAPLASRLILWDMPGHGDATGTCSLGTREVGALKALIEVVKAERPLVLFGWSLGAGVSIAAAAAAPGTPSLRDGTPVAAVITEAPYRLAQTPARNVLRAWGLPYRANLPLALAALGTRFGVGPSWRGFDRAALAARLPCPLLVIHGERDEVCPLDDGRAIAGAARSGTLAAIPGAGHHGLWTDESAAPRCEAAARDFLARALNSGHVQQPHR